MVDAYLLPTLLYICNVVPVLASMTQKFTNPLAHSGSSRMPARVARGWLMETRMLPAGSVT